MVRIWTGRDETFLTDCVKLLQSFKDSWQKSHQASIKVQGHTSHTTSRVAHSLPRVLQLSPQDWGEVYPNRKDLMVPEVFANINEPMILLFYPVSLAT